MRQRPKTSAVAASKAALPVTKKPRKIVGLGVHRDDHPLWRLSLLDVDHDLWGWGNVTGPELRDVLALLKEMERLTWKEIRAQLTGTSRRGPKHKFIPMDALCKAAQDRLVYLELDDSSDSWFRFRLGNMRRLWGVVEDALFYPVWWDPRHEVCPSETD